MAGKGIEVPLFGVIKKITANEDTLQQASALINQHLGIDFGDMKSPGDLAGGGSQIAGKAGDAILKVMQTSLGIIEDIYKKLVESSPLLQAIESLFNIAMQLFFMPLGNKLAEEMIPAILEMIDEIMDFWEDMEGKSLEEILEETLDRFVTIFVGYLRNIGTRLEQHGGLLGSIGKLLNTIANLVEKFLPTLIDWSVGILQFLMENFPLLVGLIVGFKVAMISLMVAQILATAAGPLGGMISMVVGGALAASIGIGTAQAISSMGDSGVSNNVSNSAYNSINTPNVSNVGGSTYNVTFNGYTDENVKDMMRDVVNEESNRNALRG